MPVDEGKVSLKTVQHTLNRFKTSLPQLYTQLRQHVEIIKTAKREANIRALNKEQIAASRTFKNLKHYLKDLDGLESRLFPSDLNKFKSAADPLRQAAYEEIVKFVQLDENLDRIQKSDLLVPNMPHSSAAPDLRTASHSVSTVAPDSTHLTQSTVPASTHPAASTASTSPSQSTQCESTQSTQSQSTELQPAIDPGYQEDLPHNSSHIGEHHPELMSLQETKNAEEDLRQLEATAQSWNQLQQDIQDVAEIMTSLSELVKTQGEEINTIEQNVEAARGKTSMGLLEIIKARRAKFAGVPVAGAVVGCMIGGPVGMLVGFKVAGVVTAALGTYVGYKSGKYFRNKVNEGVEEEVVPGMLVAPAARAYTDDEEEGDLTDDSGEFQEFDEIEIKLSENYRAYKK